MKKIWWQTFGKGSHHLVLLHGWGLNAGIWHCVQEKLASQFTLHLVDLPGFGRSQGYGALSLYEMAKCILERAPQKAIWLGWSLGGLVASQVALIHMSRVQALVTVASSPRFSACKKWPGIRSDVLANFQYELINNFHGTVKNFLSLQTMGAETARQDLRTLRRVVFSLPIPPVEVLNGGLEILRTADLRKSLSVLCLPHLRLYGYLDSLVPYKIVPLLDVLWPQSKSTIIATAAHAPFISHPNEFCATLTELVQSLN